MRSWAWAVLAWASLAGATAVEPFAVSGAGRGAFLTNGMGARPAGMGEAFTAVADDASAVSWNPAGLAAVGNLGVVASYEALAPGVGLSYLAGAAPAGPGAAGFGITVLNFEVAEQRDALGASHGAATFMDLGMVAGWAMPHAAFGSREGATGVTVEVAREAVGGTLVAMGAGGAYAVRPGFTAAWAVAHVGPRVGGFSLPAVAKVGGAYVMGALGTLGLDVAHEVSSRRTWVAAGCEVTAVPRVAVRAGYKTLALAQGLDGLAGVTAGAGVRLARFGLDYAYQPFGTLATAHRISLTYGFGVPERVPVNAEVSSPAEAAYREAVERYAARDYDGAWARAYAALQADPTLAAAWQMIGNCQFAKGDKAGALDSYRRALALNPANETLKAFVESLGH